MWIQVAVDTILGQVFMNTVTRQWDSFWCVECWDCSREIIWFCWCWYVWTDWLTDTILFWTLSIVWFLIRHGIAECRTQRYSKWLRLAVSKGSTRSGACLAWRLQRSQLPKRRGSVKKLVYGRSLQYEDYVSESHRSSKRYGVGWLDALRMSFRHC